MVHPAGTVHVYDVAFATAEMLYVNPVTDGHTVVVPVIAPGVAGAAGLTTTAKILALLVPQELVAVTEIFPFCPALPAVTVIDVPPFADVIVHPDGTVHVYETAFATAAML